MKKIKLFLCIALFGAMSFGAFSAYDYYTMSDEERFLLTNIEALTQYEPGGGGDGEFVCKLIKDPCVITIRTEGDLIKIKNLKFGSYSIGAEVDLTDLTRLYTSGSEVRCGTDKTCYDVFH